LGIASRIMPENGVDPPGAGAELFVSPCFFLEGLELATDYLLRDAGHVCEVIVNDYPDLAVDLRKGDAFPGQHLDACHEGLVDRFSDLGEQADVHLLDAVDFPDRFLRDLSREEVVDLADMVDRVLAAGRFHAHRAVGGNKPVAPVATPDRTVVAHLCRCASHCQKHALFPDIVRGVNVHDNLAFRALLCDLADLFGQDAHVLLVFLDIRTVLINDGTGDGQGDRVPVPQAHDLDVLPDGRVLLAEFCVDIV